MSLTEAIAAATAMITRSAEPKTCGACRAIYRDTDNVVLPCHAHMGELTYDRRHSGLQFMSCCARVASPALPGLPIATCVQAAHGLRGPCTAPLTVVAFATRGEAEAAVARAARAARACAVSVRADVDACVAEHGAAFEAHPDYATVSRYATLCSASAISAPSRYAWTSPDVDMGYSPVAASALDQSVHFVVAAAADPASYPHEDARLALGHLASQLPDISYRFLSSPCIAMRQVASDRVAFR
jgi:hypothetical protein